MITLDPTNPDVAKDPKNSDMFVNTLLTINGLLICTFLDADQLSSSVISVVFLEVAGISIVSTGDNAPKFTTTIDTSKVTTTPTDYEATINFDETRIN